jgi:hypothetical protein
MHLSSLPLFFSAAPGAAVVITSGFVQLIAADAVDVGSFSQTLIIVSELFGNVFVALSRSFSVL